MGIKYTYNTKVCLSNESSSFPTALAWMLPKFLSVTFVRVLSGLGACLVIVTAGVSRGFVAGRVLVWLVVECMQ